jgi:cell division protein FtsB
VGPPPLTAARVVDDLDVQIARLEAELATLYQRRRDRDHAAILLAILHVTDGWFRTHELLGAVVVSSELSRWFAGKSAKSVGRLLRAIADDQDRAVTLPALRLLRHKTTKAATVWKIETYLPASAATSIGR